MATVPATDPEPGVEQAAFSATLVDEWVRAGVTDAVVAPGSRSSPLALALAADARIRLHVHLDERAAGFLALGLGLASGRPAVVLTTSGTAAVELHPGVVEAHQAGVPLLACTADRPPELQDIGAPQTVDQRHLYGPAVRWSVTASAGDGRAAWRSVAARAVAEARGARSGGWPGPVHVNLPFRDPLVAEPADLPPGRAGGRPWHVLAATQSAVTEEAVSDLAGRLSAGRGLIVAGGGCGDPDGVHGLAARLGWPVLADPRSGAYRPGPATVAHWDAVLRAASFTDGHRPDAVLRLGAPPASKVLSQWLAALDVDQVQVGSGWWDPERTAATVAGADPTRLCEDLARLVAPTDPAWPAAWVQAGERAAEAVDKALAEHGGCSEPRTAREVVAALPDGAALVVSSSMPIRDVEWYAAPRVGVRILANRGANGIDGVVSTAVGVALAHGGPTVALVGDVAFLHDSNGLLGARDRGVDLVVVVADNDGGGIFSFLPAADAVPAATFERLFGTPHGVRVEEQAAVHGVASLTVEDAEALPVAVRSAVATGGVWLVVVRTRRAANVAVHDQIHAAVAAALA